MHVQMASVNPWHSPLVGRMLLRNGLNFTPEGTISHRDTDITNGEAGVWVKMSSWAFLFWCEINCLRLVLEGPFLSVGFYLFII